MRKPGLVARAVALSIIIGLPLLLLLVGCKPEDTLTAEAAIRADVEQRHPQCAGLRFDGGFAGDTGVLLQCATYYELVRLNDNLEASR